MRKKEILQRITIKIFIQNYLKTHQSFNVLIDHDEAWACSFIFLLSHDSDSLYKNYFSMQ